MKLVLTPGDAEQLLADRLKAARKRSGLTQAELAERALVGVATVARLESTGRGQIATLLRVLAVLGHLRDVEALLPEPGPTTLDALRRLG